MFDRWKMKKALCKAYKLYNEKKMLYLKANTIDLYQQLEDISYAIAYVLCEYFNLKCNNPWSYKWEITYDYTHHYNECKEAYEKFAKQNTINITEHDYIVWSTNDFKRNNYSKGDIIHNMENGCLYYYDGKKFINMC